MIRFTMTNDISDTLRNILDSEVTAMSQGLRRGMDAAATKLQTELRSQVLRAGLGAGMANAWRKEIYPTRARRTLAPAGLVYSKATELHAVFEEGPVALPRVGRFLLIPSDAAEKLGATYTTRARKGGVVPGGQKRRVSDLDVAAQKLGVPIIVAGAGGNRRKAGAERAERRGYILITRTRGNASRLVALYYASKEAKPVLLFTLVRQSRVPKLLDIAGAAERSRNEFGNIISTYLAAER
jgi:hypothetical protein